MFHANRNNPVENGSWMYTIEEKLLIAFRRSKWPWLRERRVPSDRKGKKWSLK